MSTEITFDNNFSPSLATLSSSTPSSIKFNQYTDSTEKNTELVGSANEIEYVSEPLSTSSSYLIGLKRKHSSSITLHPSTVYHIHPHLNTAAHSSSHLTQQSQHDRYQARNALGDAFGTKKAKKAIKEAERNNVDIEAMANVSGYIQQDIATNTDVLPSRTSIKAIADSKRPLPTYNESGSSLEEVYNLSNLISDPEFNSCKVDQILTASPTFLTQLLPTQSNNNYILDRITALKASKSNKQSRSKIRLLVYMSHLFAFNGVAKSSRSKIAERLNNPPPVLLDGIFNKFTESSRGSTKHSFTTFSQAKLINWILILALHIDDNSVDPTQLARELSMPTQKINDAFKAVGCNLVPLSATQREKAGTLNTQSESTQDASKSAKRAVLKTPLQFPQVRRGKATR
ncbi:hypothetical protein E3P92_00073 [Wallemia ichthyophaga]|uniref:DNA-directed RNA polymerase I subunit rpa49 n=2 Tax=Wallemia ichthyophaga TaxID=245174 RepID=A0A4T0L9G8_WALIC|nr:DNA-directed RNA polymerase I subunit rpa49 [Wallemia ichthyophaga EXF-994]TIA76133.1 hypothetical protein E3P91_00073 [Wallemia ichthyophaga]EOR04130.1 DNA-directed RNA polymerase I subunit rpa49 [Wallemia ichthyophaga EXF-994]TIA94495.1 hypothetical protein E3P97_00073 [Wallemia ichthyophaga]TIB04811.1 hypothetical protein E3P95_00073 [Wallemia ichthyophaga]TIB05988.1 hypothetical protein E3P94_00073 [Wallemia ichthyophaga]